LFDAANCDALFEGKRVVLFIDEFDLLEHAATAVHDEVLHVLRGLKQSGSKNCLHSVVAVGPFSILRLNTERSGSPFNVSDAVPVDLFSQEQVSSLFVQLAKARHARVDAQIAADVFDRTDGHPGLVAWCGKMVDERLLRGKGGVGVDEWEAWAARDLVHTIRGWSTMEKMVTMLLNDDMPRVREARRLLVQSVLPHPGVVPVLPAERSLAEFMVAEGALRQGLESELDFAVRSDLVRAVLLAHVLPAERRQPPAEPFPLKDGAVDVVAMLERAVTCFSRPVMAAAPRWSYKWFEGVADGRRVPHEFTYHFELVTVLQSWVPSDILVSCEVKRGHGNKRTDIVIQQRGGESVIIELLASCTAGGKTGVDAHCASAEEYQNALGAAAAYVVHFIAAWPPASTPPGHGGRSSVPIVSVYHDATFTNVEVVADGR